MVKRWLWLFLLLGVASATVSVTNNGTYAVVNNSFIKVIFPSNEYFEVYSFNGTDYVHLIDFQVRLDSVQTSLVDSSFTTLVNTSDSVVLNMSVTGSNSWNITLEGGFNFIQMINNTEMQYGDASEDDYIYIKGIDSGAWYVHQPNVTLMTMNTSTTHLFYGFEDDPYIAFYNPLINHSAFVGFNTEADNDAQGFRISGLNTALLKWQDESKLNYFTVGVLPFLLGGDTVGVPTDYKRYYKLDEGTGTIISDSGYSGVNLTGVGSPSWVSGYSGYATALNGVDQYWATPNDLADIGNDTTGTVCIWFYMDIDDGGTDIAWGISNNATAVDSSVGLLVAPATDTIASAVSVDGIYQWYAYTAFDSLDPCFGEWCHACVVQNGTAPSIYLNGEWMPTTLAYEVDKTAWIDDITGAAEPADAYAIGVGLTNGSLASPFNGTIDEQIIYSRALSSEEISGLYNATNDIATDYYWDNWTFTGYMDDDYVRYWSFDEATGTTVDDKSGDDADLTGVDTPVWVEGKQHYGTGLDGSADYWYSTDLTNLIDDTTGTVCGWVHKDSDDEESDVWFSYTDFDTNDQTRAPFSIRANDGEYFQAGIKIDGTWQWLCESNNGYTMGEWIHVCVVQDGVSPSIYVNGKYDNDAACTTTTDLTAWWADMEAATNKADQITVGAMGNNNGYTNYLTGILDEIRIYSKALTPNEIKSLYGIGLPNSLNDNINATYLGVNRQESFAKLFAEASVLSDFITRQTHDLGTNSTYTTFYNEYINRDNDFSLFVNNTNLLGYCETNYNLFPNTNLFNELNNETFRHSADYAEAIESGYEWNLTVYWPFDSLDAGDTIEQNEAEPPSFNLTDMDAGGNLVTGKYGNAFDFDGNSKDSTAMTSSTRSASFSVCAWARSPSNISIRGLMAKADTNSGVLGDWDWRIWQQVGAIYMSPEDDSQGWVNGCSYANDQWFHFCFSYDHPSTTMRSYCNGNLLQTKDITFENTLDHKIWLASQQSTRWQGEIDEFYFFNRSITSAEANSIYYNRTFSSYRVNTSCTTTGDVVLGMIDSIGATPSLSVFIHNEKDRNRLGSNFEASITLSNGLIYGLAGTENSTQHDIYIYPPYSTLSNTTVLLNPYQTGYGYRYHWLYNYEFTNITDSINMYLLSNIYSTEITIKVVDTGNINQPNHTVIARREYPSLGGFINVASCITDSEGECSLALETSTPRYNFIVMNETHDIVKNTEAITISDTTQIINIGTIIVNDYYNLIGNVNGVISYTNSSGNITFVLDFTDTSGDLSTAYLKVIENNLTGTQTIHQSSLNASSGSINVNVGNVTGRSFLISAWGDFEGNIYTFNSTSYDFRSQTTLTNAVDTPLMLLLMTGTMMFIAPASPPMSILLGVFGFIFGSLIGFTNLAYGSLVGLVVTAIVVIGGLGKQ